MLVVSRAKQTFEDRMFADLPQYLGPGDCIALNNTRVFPARLHGYRNHATGASVEVFLIRAKPGDETIWAALVKPAKRVRSGDTILFGSGLRADVIEESEYGERTLKFHAAESVSELFERLGSTPLPPYIHRKPGASDKERYQTVFAKKKGSVAAPTAGLHFTEKILEQCRAAGASLAYVTLHVGLGTFAPLREARLEKIQLHEEYFELQPDDAAVMAAAQRIVCVGTTTVRTLETAMLRGGLKEVQGDTNLFISPGFEFKATGALLTNFHLPQSSLLILASSFAGKDLALRAYRYAVEQRYRFFSYGDCMLIV